MRIIAYKEAIKIMEDADINKKDYCKYLSIAYCEMIKVANTDSKYKNIADELHRLNTHIDVKNGFSIMGSDKADKDENFDIELEDLSDAYIRILVDTIENKLFR